MCYIFPAARGTKSVKKSDVLEGHRMFKERAQDEETILESGLPKTHRSVENVESFIVKQMLSTRQVARELNVENVRVKQTLKATLHKTICSTDKRRTAALRVAI